VKQRVLMIDDDEDLAGMVGEYLEGAGLAFAARHDVATGLAALHDRPERPKHPDAGPFDLVILDVMLPDGDGFEVCRRIRATSTLPILMLTARGDETDRIVGLELGADDYLPKPFNPRELLARIRAILRRRTQGAPESGSVLRFGRLEIDTAARSVSVDGEERPLTSHQFDLLCALADSRGRVLSRDELMGRLRGRDLEAFDRSIDVHISRLRAAVEDDPKRPRRIITVRGAGYVFAARQDDE
jgi:two-component system phosphate regulon response regulator OmpR